MELMKVVLLLMILISVCGAASLPSCSWTHFRLRRLNEECIGLLKNMGDRMPLECLQLESNIFPDDVFNKSQNEDVALVALETLKGVNKIFRNKQTSVTWNQDQLGLFKNIIHRQVKNLQECVEKEVQTVMDSSSAILRPYFERLEKRLKEKKFSSCGWEMVRTQLQDGLEKFQTFLESKK
ncbi:interferon alpha-4-like [Silurus meridionalis]|uniref:Uncharacterized protein n=1 Tax=Silurus meridionalis TaxID=175797 RepID=A0A8T0AF66_SILME|nr:interferon alpha-4-like [Silurus meridionalis]KAF7690895.1 hypothetical protein HF521_011192 [Silurus meridionalis]